MYLTIKQQLKHLSKEDYKILKELCRCAKNLTNEALYSIRQYYFNEGKYLNYDNNYKLLKSSNNYKMLNSNMAQQILKEVDGSFKSFFELLKLKKDGKYDSRVKLPGYLPKNGYTSLIIGFVRLNNNRLIIPYSNKFKKNHKLVEISLPPILLDKEIKEIRIIPKSNARFFEIQYTYKIDCIDRNLNTNNALALDLGINNLISAVSNKGKTFIIDGKKLKSINQYYNKINSRLQSIKDKQKIKGNTLQQDNLTKIRNNKVNDYLNKSARLVINYCIKENIGTLIVGYNENFQSGSNLGKVNNQNFVNIPFGRLIDKLEYLCQLNNIVFIKQEESFTSKSSFWDKDKLPKLSKKKYKFSGNRIKRGLYKTKDGKLLNADINGALNIMRKSSVVDLSVLYSRGEVDTPARIRVV